LILNESQATKQVPMDEKKTNIIQTIFSFYLNGFKNMGQWGQQVWIIILIKLFIMFAVLKIFFFPDFLNTNFKTDQERSDHVLELLTESDK
jgi:uncharacterized membrane protein